MKIFLLAAVILVFLTPITSSEKDLYKTLGVSRDASERDIKKSFHKLSLKYHPDKNPSKSAQAKFQEISAAYDVLSDEEKRKKYDVYGTDDPESPPGSGPAGGSWSGFPGAGSRSPGGGKYGHTFQFQSGGMPSDGIPFGDIFGGMGGSSGAKKFGFDMGDLLSAFVGAGGVRGFGSQQGSDSKIWKSLTGARKLSAEEFSAKVATSEHLWLVVFSSLGGSQLLHAKSMLEEVAKELSGMAMVGVVNCVEEKALCAKYSARSQVAALLFPYGAPQKAKPKTYRGALSKRAVVKWVKEHIPNHSIRLDPIKYEAQLEEWSGMPRAILLSGKEKSSALWRALSITFKGRAVLFVYHSAGSNQERILTDFQVTSFPAVLGIGSRGERVMYTGESKLEPLSAWLETLEKKGNSRSSGWGWGARSATQPESGLEKNGIGFLSRGSVGRLCGPNCSLCIIAVVPTAAQSEEASHILRTVSQTTLLQSRAQPFAEGLSFSLLDSSAQKQGLQAFPGVKAPGKGQITVVAYKPKRQRFKAMVGSGGLEEVESFIVRAVEGELRFQNTKGLLELT